MHGERRVDQPVALLLQRCRRGIVPEALPGVHNHQMGTAAPGLGHCDRESLCAAWGIVVADQDRALRTEQRIGRHHRDRAARMTYQGGTDRTEQTALIRPEPAGTDDHQPGALGAFEQSRNDRRVDNRCRDLDLGRGIRRRPGRGVHRMTGLITEQRVIVPCPVLAGAFLGYRRHRRHHFERNLVQRGIIRGPAHSLHRIVGAVDSHHHGRLGHHMDVPPSSAADHVRHFGEDAPTLPTDKRLS